MRLMLLTCVVLIVVLPQEGRGRARQVKVAPIDFSSLERVILAELSETNTPGAALGIVSGDRVIFAKGFGVADVETGAPVTPDMLFRLGSTTKMFTAAALVKLVEEGKLKLDEPIARYAKGLSPAIGRLTPAQLLSHTAGLKDDAVMFGKHDDAELGETVRALKDDFLFAAPGRIFSYSNPGYWLAGYVIEEVSGRAYADQMSESLFKPLGMQRTTLRPTMAMTFPLSQGHEGTGKEKPKVIRPFADNTGNWPAGSMFSSVNDLARFVIAFMNNGMLEGKQVLSQSLIAELSTPRTEVPGTDSKYGFGLSIGPLRGVHLLQHGGSRSGFGSLIRMAPEQRIAVIVLINRTGGTLNKTAEKAMELMLPLEAEKQAKPEPRTMTEAEMTRYSGVYGDAPNRIEIMLRQGRLYLKRGSQEGLVKKIGDSRFSAMIQGEAAPLEFAIVTGPDGKAEFLQMGMRAMKKVP
jgi:CubicO group peptidase (beta-lactamase class C family)